MALFLAVGVLGLIGVPGRFPLLRLFFAAFQAALKHSVHHCMQGNQCPDFVFMALQALHNEAEGKKLPAVRLQLLA
jgi:hypothetical protein